MKREIARLPESVKELCLLRLGFQARKFTALPYVFRLKRAIERDAAAAIASGSGLLDSFTFSITPFHYGVIQYWRTFEDLEAWSHRSPHSDWWKEAVERLRTKEDFGIYHETFLVAPEKIESIYLNTLPTGLLAFGALAEPTGPDANSRGRLRRDKNTN